MKAASSCLACLALLCWLLLPVQGGAAGALQTAPPRGKSSGAVAQSQTMPPLDVYSPPAAVRAKAIHYSRVRDGLYFAESALGLAIYAFLWLSGFGVWLRRIAECASTHLFIQCLVFVPVFWGAASILGFPLDYYGDYIVERRFGLSMESFGTWFGDWSKSLGLGALAAVIIVWIFYRIVRRSPRRWWFYFWLAIIPLAAFVMLIQPYVIEPLFYKFTPLAKTEPALTMRVETMLLHAGVIIPESRIFEMDASSKTRELNAYVSGWGSSKRVVIWDTTLRELTPDETLAVLAHETGHYALHHIAKIFALIELVALGGIFLGYLAAGTAMRRWGRQTGLTGVADLASLPLMMLILSAGIFFASPAICAVSRHYEHQADQYGLELIYGIVPNPNAAMVGAFRVLGERDLSNPDPNSFIRFWLYDHPPLADRIRFAAHYKPWAQGKPMELMHSAASARAKDG